MIPVLRDRPTTVFVGAGLSFHAGCPLLDELIETLHTAAINHTGKELILNGDWKEKAQICKRELGVANFNQILIDKFNPENRRLNFTSLHTSLIQIPFKSIVTTNFDSCIELADRDSKIWRTFYYPNLNVIELGNKSIQHIHGYIDPENPNGTVGSIILTSEDFIEAYRDNPGSVKRFLVDLFSLHNVIFLGFNLGDETLMEILENNKSQNLGNYLQYQKQFILQSWKIQLKSELMGNY